jgi:phage tail sheath protein FI
MQTSMPIPNSLLSPFAYMRDFFSGLHLDSCGPPKFGLQFIRTREESQPVIAADLSTIGIIGPASTADTETFPLNFPVKVYSNDLRKIEDLGDFSPMVDALNAINNQLGEFQNAAQVVVVRIAEGTDPDPLIRTQQTIGKIMGRSTDGTGVWAFLKSPNECACTPRIIVAPGYTGQMADSLDFIDVDVHGSGYTPGVDYPITFTGGGTSVARILPEAHAKANILGRIDQADIVIDSYGAFLDHTAVMNATLPPAPTPVQATATCAIVDGAVTQFVPGTTGSGYTPGVNIAVTFSGGGGVTQATGHAVANSLGQIGADNLYLDSPGAGYTSIPTVTIAAPPAPANATLTTAVAAGANPVCVALPAVLNQLIAHAIVESAGLSEELDEDWRETMQSDRIIAMSGGIKIYDPDLGVVVVKPIAPYVAGILVRRDHETGAPFHSAANQPIQGVVGPARSIGFSITDDANEGQQLLKNNIGIVVRGEVGSDFAIASGGFVLIVLDNVGEDELWRMYNVMRGRDFIHISLMKTLRYYLGRYNITGHTIQAILNTIGFFLRDLKARDHILGYKVEFLGSLNSADEIRLGHLTVGFRAEEPPVLERITTMSSRYRPAIDAMVSQIERQLNMAA